MSVYVISDLHGERSRFFKMLRRINLQKDDTLYILGDVIDRGPDGIALLQQLMNMDNVRMLLGNHEYMCLQYFAPDTTELDRRRWNRNGNYPTLAALDKLSDTEREQVFNYLSQLEDHAQLTVRNRVFHLVHGWPGENVHDRVWGRPEKDAISMISDATVIIGHTPVCEYVCPGSDEDMYVYSRKLSDSGDHFRIFRAKGFIDIDCCCGYGMSAARLACLCLDDMQEYYV